MHESFIKKAIKAIFPFFYRETIDELAARLYPPTFVVTETKVSFTLTKYADGHYDISNLVSPSAISLDEHYIICSALKRAEQNLNHEKRD